jgi:hypothetical protein
MLASHIIAGIITLLHEIAAQQHVLIYYYSLSGFQISDIIWDIYSY